MLSDRLEVQIDDKLCPIRVNLSEQIDCRVNVSKRQQRANKVDLCIAKHVAEYYKTELQQMVVFPCYTKYSCPDGGWKPQVSHKGEVNGHLINCA